MFPVTRLDGKQGSRSLMAVQLAGVFFLKQKLVLLLQQIKKRIDLKPKV